MAKVSFEQAIKSTDNQVAPEVESTPNTNTALVPREDRTVSTYVEDTDAQGEFDASDDEKVYLTIVAKTGELSNLFTPGDLLLNKEYVIGGSKSPIEVTAIGIRKRYQNDLDYDGGEIGDVVDKAIEVLNRGGVVEYRPFDDKISTHYWKPILQILFLVKRPNELPPAAAALFPFTFGDSDYAVVGYTARTKTAYNGIAKPLIYAKKTKGTVRSTTYRLSVKGETWEKRSWIQPSLRSIGATSAELAQFFSENYNN